MEQTLEQKVDRLIVTVASLKKQLQVKKKETWVGVATIKLLTGWAGENLLRRMRKDGCVVYDKDKGYLLESIHPMFLLKNKN